MGQISFRIPSWTQPATYEYVQYVTMSNIQNKWAAAGSFNLVAGYPTGNAKKAVVILQACGYGDMQLLFLAVPTANDGFMNGL